MHSDVNPAILEQSKAQHKAARTDKTTPFNAAIIANLILLIEIVSRIRI